MQRAKVTVGRSMKSESQQFCVEEMNSQIQISRAVSRFKFELNLNAIHVNALKELHRNSNIIVMSVDKDKVNRQLHTNAYKAIAETYHNNMDNDIFRQTRKLYANAEEHKMLIGQKYIYPGTELVRKVHKRQHYVYEDI
ncbi:hypothetical protein GJ496_011277 [Pomphorhynchus laevis]|nr:hypothetical protein GJ496_011277 [Pomphorhynchus laevis]